MSLDIGLILLGAAGVLSWGSWRIGREFPTARRLEEIYGERLQGAYNSGYDQAVLTLTGQDDPLTVALSTGRGAAGDGPAPLPAPPMMCPGGRRCIRGPEPHQWSADCEEDEGWTDDPPVLHGRQHGAGDGLTRASTDSTGEDWYGTMRRELAPEAERPASHTEQFRAILGHADKLEREFLLTLDSGWRYERGRAKYLREGGISEQRIREILGAE